MDMNGRHLRDIFEETRNALSVDVGMSSAEGKAEYD
jgi:hypothetical protein